MSELVQAILRFLRSLKVWVIVSPWEQAVRVRGGKRVSVLNAGLHVKIPVLDVVLVQSTRLRFTSCGRQTVTTQDGKTVTCDAAVGYEIANLEKLYRSCHHAEDTIRQMARGAVATHFSTVSSENLSLDGCCKGVGALIDLGRFGLSVEEIVVTDIAIVRTYRLIGDYSGSYVSGSALDTESKEQTKA